MRYLIFFILTSFLVKLNAQDEIDKLLNEADNTKTEYTIATFKSTRIISGQSIERMPEGQLDFRISHRFGQINSGLYNWYGLDEAYIHYGFDYGITDWLMVGIGRGNVKKTFDGFYKLSLLRQSKGEKNMPVSLSFLSSISIFSQNRTDLGNKPLFWDRASYVHQLLVARKFSERFSLELNPTFVHRNMVESEMNPNDLWSIGAGTRFKLTKRLSINAEYYYVIPPRHDFRETKTYDPFSIGIELETGGHVFQIFLSNSRTMIEKGYIGETTGNWLDGGIHIGFNISRVFTLY
jgi:opacity protein-like surface antigen